MITLYKLILFLHIASAAMWLGGGVVMEFLHLRLGKNPTAEGLREFFSIADWVSPRIFMPAALSTLATGLILIFMGGAAFADLWIILALVGVALTIFLGATQIGPSVKKITSLLESGREAQVDSIARRLTFVTYIDLSLLFLVLFDMVVKPTL